MKLGPIVWMAALAVLGAVDVGCKDTRISCVRDGDCCPGYYCDNVMTLVSEVCVEAPSGQCRVLEHDMLGGPCSTDQDCKEDSLACLRSSGICGVLACPEAVSSITCSPGCINGGRPWCAACTCPSCTGDLRVQSDGSSEATQ